MLDIQENARLGQSYDVIPTNYYDIAVTNSAVLFDLNALLISTGIYLSLGGKWVRFRALTAAVTFIAADLPTLAAGAGVLLALNADSQRYFIPPPYGTATTQPLTVISTTNATLRVFYNANPY